MSKRDRLPLSEAEQVALDRVMDSIAAHVDRLTQAGAYIGAEAGELIRPFSESAVDFGPLIKVLAKIRAEHCQTTEQQRAVFERALLEYELDPNEYDWTLTAEALETLAGYAETMSHREWTPGRDDLAPLFELEELAAS